MKKNISATYADPAAAKAYIRYVESSDGQAERQMLALAILPLLPPPKKK